MNNIEKNVCGAQEYVEKAKEDTKQATLVRKGGRRVGWPASHTHTHTHKEREREAYTHTHKHTLI